MLMDIKHCSTTTTTTIAQTLPPPLPSALPPALILFAFLLMVSNSYNPLLLSSPALKPTHRANCSLDSKSELCSSKNVNSLIAFSLFELLR